MDDLETKIKKIASDIKRELGGTVKITKLGDGDQYYQIRWSGKRNGKPIEFQQIISKVTLNMTQYPVHIVSSFTKAYHEWTKKNHSK